MDLGSIAKMFEPPYGELVKTIIGMTIFMPIAASIDLGHLPG
ncbi:hypothetical protein M2280_001320 [Prescottella agglutinans]|uniref:Uncharacterized protein n=1 Tax=Prescottella agglutinans TaxID=1644129 RepID=A0ABT6M722_9NOCA|nr:hypothetical protein [Prescottella agglutinans]